MYKLTSFKQYDCRSLCSSTVEAPKGNKIMLFGTIACDIKRGSKGKVDICHCLIMITILIMRVNVDGVWCFNITQT
jgi:hypothetical protein